MAKCDRCGVDGAKEISGRVGRIAWLKSSYTSAPEERKTAIAERIMDLCMDRDHYRCGECATCGCCYLEDGNLIDCAICHAPACMNCSLPALRVDQNGKIIENSDDGSVLCSRCNPPSGGRNAGLGLPTPVHPLTVG